MVEDNDKTLVDDLSNTKAAVCPLCYDYLVAQQIFASPDKPEEIPVIWVFYCARCKEQREPKLMDVSERMFLNVRAMRKAKEVQK